MSSKSAHQGLRGSEAHAKTRILLVVWDSGGIDVKKGDLTKRLTRTGERASDYQKILEQLEQDGALKLGKNKISLLEPKAMELLRDGLKSEDFEFDSAVGAKTVNALLKWIRKMGDSVNSPAGSAKPTATQIGSYEAFKSEALLLFEKLNKSYNYGGLVPVWHLRRELDDQVGREDFNDWLMKMQGDQLFYLQSGEARGATEDQKRDSITSEVRGLLFFASKPV